MLRSTKTQSMHSGSSKDTPLQLQPTAVGFSLTAVMCPGQTSNQSKPAVKVDQSAGEIKAESATSTESQTGDLDIPKECVLYSKAKRRIYYQCAKCPALQYTPGDYRRHQLAHGANLPFGCRYCDFSSNFTNGVKNHESMHERMQPQSTLASLSPAPGSDLHTIATAITDSEQQPKKKIKAEQQGSSDEDENDLPLSRISSSKREDSVENEISTKVAAVNSISLTSKFAVPGKPGQPVVLQCDRCPFQDTKPVVFLKHYEGHGANRLYKCNYCDFSSNRGAGIHKHEIKQHGFSIRSVAQHLKPTSTDADNSAAGHKLGSQTSAKPPSSGDSNSSQSAIILGQPRIRKEKRTFTIALPVARTKKRSAISSGLLAAKKFAGAVSGPIAKVTATSSKFVAAEKSGLSKVAPQLPQFRAPQHCFKPTRGGAVLFNCDKCPLTDQTPERGHLHYQKHGALLRFRCDRPACDYSSNTTLGIRKHIAVHDKAEGKPIPLAFQGGHRGGRYNDDLEQPPSMVVHYSSFKPDPTDVSFKSEHSGHKLAPDYRKRSLPALYPPAKRPALPAAGSPIAIGSPTPKLERSLSISSSSTANNSSFDNSIDAVLANLAAARSSEQHQQKKAKLNESLTSIVAAVASEKTPISPPATSSGFMESKPMQKTFVAVMSPQFPALYSCKLCKLRYKRKKMLINHMFMSHSNDSGMMRKNSLPGDARPLQLSTGNRQCLLCAFSTKSMETFQIHIKGHMNELGCFHCPLCPIILKTYGRLKYHMSSHAGTAMRNAESDAAAESKSSTAPTTTAAVAKPLSKSASELIPSDKPSSSSNATRMNLVSDPLTLDTKCSLSSLAAIMEPSPEDVAETESYFADLRALVEGSAIASGFAGRDASSALTASAANGFLNDFDCSFAKLLESFAYCSSSNALPVLGGKQETDRSTGSASKSNGFHSSMLATIASANRAAEKQDSKGSRTKSAYFRCPECKFMVDNAQTLNKHLWTHDYAKDLTKSDFDKIQANHRGNIKCKSCPYVCPSQGALIRHTIRHEEPSRYRCPYCTYSSDKANWVRVHILHHDEFIVSCNIVDTSPSALYARSAPKLLPDSMAAAIAETVAKVIDQNNSSPSTSSTKNGGSQSMPDSPLLLRLPEPQPHPGFKCKLCGYRCRQRKFARRHSRNHKLRLRLKCDDCSFTTASKRKLASHRFLHLRSNVIKYRRFRRPFTCWLCCTTTALHGQFHKHQQTSLQHSCSVVKALYRERLKKKKANLLSAQGNEAAALDTPDGPKPLVKSEREETTSASAASSEVKQEANESAIDLSFKSLTSAQTANSVQKETSASSEMFRRPKTDVNISLDSARQAMPQHHVANAGELHEDNKSLKKCPHCPYTTKYAYDLPTHTRMHQGKRKHRCAFCSYSTQRQGALRHHQRLHYANGASVKFRSPKKDSGSLVNAASVQPLVNAVRKMPNGKVVVDKEGKEIGRLLSLNSARIYSCLWCPYNTTLNATLVSHSRMHSGNRPFKCTKCSFNSEVQRRLVDHTLVHEPGYVNQSQSQSSELITSSSGKATARFQTVTSSTASRPSVSGASSQIKIQSPYSKSGKVYQCNSCPFSVASYAGLWYHLQKHKKPAKFKCNSCSFQTEGRHLLSEHEAWHSKKLQADANNDEEISAAERRVTRGCSLNNSPNKANNESLEPEHSSNATLPSLKCNKCDYEANTFRALFWHKQNHDKEVSHVFKCTSCPFKANSHASWWQHRRTHRKNDEQLQCDRCDFVADSEESYASHAEQHETSTTDEKLDATTTDDQTTNKLKTSRSDSETNSNDDDIRNRLRQRQAKDAKSQAKSEKTAQAAKASSNGNATGAAVSASDEEETHKCAKCPYETASSAYLRLHSRMHDANRTNKCKICSFSSSHVRTLRNHMRWHQQKLPAVLKQEDSSEELTKPKATIRSRRDKTSSVSNEAVSELETPQRRLLSCYQCPFRCKAPEKLAEHERYHEVPAKFFCSRCSFSADDEGIIKKHESLHSTTSESSSLLTTREVYKYFCPKCSFTCEFPTNFWKHVNMHGRRDGYTCCICDYSGTRLSVIKFHEQNHHAHVPFTLLTINGKTSLLDRKHAEHSNSSFSSSSSTASSSNNVSLLPPISNPLKTRPIIKCMFCEFRASSARDLQEHMPSHMDDVSRGCESDFLMQKYSYLAQLNIIPQESNVNFLDNALAATKMAESEHGRISGAE